ncbi:MAG: methyltransferase domain-containing protein [Xanthomonadaceae bacterium]|nr:methyltransferase domain-containing protein [Xanthomonadaceae bacterium]
MAHQRLTYESLEKLKVDRPVDRLGYISAACTGKGVLDIGCFDETALEKRGTEHWLHGRILQTANEVFGIDISDKIPPEGVVTGANGRILRRDAAKLDLDGIPAGQIQVIVAGEFIEHIESPMAFFREVKQKLGGRELIISTPNGVCFANTLMGIIGREVQHPDHLHNLTYKTLNTQCQRAGFESWEIIPYRFYATEMILASTGAKRMFVKLVQACIRGVERCFPLLSFGYIARIRI